MNALTDPRAVLAQTAAWLDAEAAAPTGRLVAVVGAGPSGVACAHRLAMLGNGVVLYEARSRERMLETLSVLALPEQDAFAQLLAVGRIRVEYGRKLGENLDLSALHLSHDAVYLGIGLAMARVLGLSGPAPAGLSDAARAVAAVVAGDEPAVQSVPQRAVVIGSGDGAVALAARLKTLGARDVTLALRHALPPDDAMQAAREHFVRVRPWLAPLEVLRDAHGAVEAVRFEQTRMLDGCLVHTGGFTEIAAHAVFKAVGRAPAAGLAPDDALRSLSHEGERIQVDGCFRSALPGIYAGGDCVAARLGIGDALRHGERAAQAIHADLQA
ncbi:FAD-dependent oxidoreductase [Massilia sp. YIM B02443]|uniref:FAD-dependent oxidoreductase n=1 Tax=Massilia sp. YIM B02443 TaxID=3050127 RepID=UPI0025B6834A|nr:FAD-dependent oxidoreductase [Massilia sp. YIM B02443]MDN4036103.1 FAD-dependent oxidoreductase [Massilia sp. YIM B02443]